MTIMMLRGALAGLVDWHITDTSAAIANKRREGWSDAQITTWLLNEENRKQSSKACPWGCTDELVAAAFAYLALGVLPPNVRITGNAPISPKPEPVYQKPSWWSQLQPSEKLKIVGGAGAIVAVIVGASALIARSRSRSRTSSDVGRSYYHEPATPADRSLLAFAERMRNIPHRPVRDDVYGDVTAVVDQKHARAIFRKVAPMATHDGVNAALQALQERLDDRASLDRIGR
jgi:hypothetical protein